MRLTRVCITLLALTVLCAPVALGQATRADVGGLTFRTTTFNNGLGFGARAMGMAGAFTAIADDASAASWNPAGLGQLIRPELTVVGGYNQASIATTGEKATYYSSTTGNPRLLLKSRDRTVDANSYGVDFASWVQPFKLGRQIFTGQISYTKNARPLNGTEALRIDFSDPAGNDLAPDLYDTTISSSGGYDSFGIGLGTGFDEKLYIGFTLNYFRGKTSTSTETRLRSYEYDSSGTQQLFADFTTEVFDEQRYEGLSANVGILIKPSSKFSVGIVYRGGWSGADVYYTDFKQKGHYTFNVNQGGVVTRQYLPFQALGSFESNATLTWPNTLGGGIAYRPVEALTIALDASQTQWSRSSVSRVPVPSTSNCTLESGLVTCPVSWTERSANFPSVSGIEQNNQTALRAGIEYVLRPGSVVIPIRVGAYRIRTIAPIYEPGDEDPETDFDGITAGLGFAIPIGQGSFLIDFAGVFDKASTSRAARLYDETGALAVTLAGSRTVKNRRYIGSLIYRF